MSLLKISGLIAGLVAVLILGQNITNIDTETANAALVPNVRFIDIDVNVPKDTKTQHQTSALETIRGEVFTIDKVVLRNGLSRGLQIMVETDDEILPAYIGPEWVLESNNLVLNPHDRVTMKGLRTNIDGFDLFVVSEVTKGQKTISIMDQNKLSAWLEISGRVLEVSTALARNEK